MDEKYRLNSDLIREYLRKECRKQSYLVGKLDCSRELLADMLRGRVPKKEATLKNLAEILGVEVSRLLIPKDGRKSA